MIPSGYVSPTCQPGTVIQGRYRVERIIGEGGMGFVLEATHLALGHPVAVKILRQDKKSAELVTRFEREAQIASQLPSEHIARVSDSGMTNAGEPFLVMELLEGRTLEDELSQRGALPIDEAIDFVLQACEGVADAHAAQLVHRDLKPANLFVTRRRDGTALVKVLDFGLSKTPDTGEVSSLTSTTTTFGTPQYMSPEQIRSAKHVDARTDQHALGCILYELLTCRPAFDADTLTALAVMIATKIPAPASSLRPGVRPETDAAIARALAKEPDDRFPDLAAFAAAVAAGAGPLARATADRVRTTLSPSAPPSRDDAPDSVTRAYRPADSAGPPTAPATAMPRPEPTVNDSPPLVARSRGLVFAPPAGHVRPPPTVADNPPPPHSQESGLLRAMVIPGAPPVARGRGILQSPFFVVGATLLSILGLTILFLLLRTPADADAAPPAPAQAGPADPPPTKAQADPPPAAEPPRPAATSAPAPHPQPQQTEKRHRRRHRR